MSTQKPYWIESYSVEEKYGNFFFQLRTKQVAIKSDGYWSCVITLKLPNIKFYYFFQSPR